jgi:hypothetical protein
MTVANANRTYPLRDRAKITAMRLFYLPKDVTDYLL